PALGNSTSTTPSQNAIRSKKRMTPALFPAARSGRIQGINLAGRLESAVRGASRFLPSFDANAQRLFRKFEQFFLENLSDFFPRSGHFRPWSPCRDGRKWGHPYR